MQQSNYRCGKGLGPVLIPGNRELSILKESEVGFKQCVENTCILKLIKGCQD